MWAGREFGAEYAADIADIISRYTKYNGRRKPELLSPDTFSLVNYQEAQRVLADWKAITSEAVGIYRKLPEHERDAFFELVPKVETPAEAVFAEVETFLSAF